MSPRRDETLYYVIMNDDLLTHLSPPASSERVLMNVHPQVRERLRALLREPEMLGVGYSAFINRACEIAETQIAERRVALA